MYTCYSRAVIKGMNNEDMTTGMKGIINVNLEKKQGSKDMNNRDRRNYLISLTAGMKGVNSENMAYRYM
jgi:hypothetical protein